MPRCGAASQKTAAVETGNVLKKIWLLACIAAVWPAMAAQNLPGADRGGRVADSIPGYPSYSGFRLAQAGPDGARARAAAPAVREIRFEIKRFLVEGNTLLDQREIDAAVAPYAGLSKDFGDVQRALDALESAYREKGYAGVRVTLPEQELNQGEVRFVVLETRVGRITVDGNKHFSVANILRTVPALVAGEAVNSFRIAESTRLANENPAKQQVVLLKSGEKDDLVDATVRVADIDPRRYSISLDNTGNESTGRTRLGLAYQHANLFDRDHVLTMQFISSPEQMKDVVVYGVGYRIPFYGLGDSLDLVAGYSDVDSGTVQGLFNVTGKGSVYAARYNQGLAKWGGVDHKLIYGIDYRAYQNNVLPTGNTSQSLVPDITVHPFSVTYNGIMRGEKQDVSFYASISQNIPGGNDGGDSAFRASRANAPASYRAYRLGGTLSRSFGSDWQAKVMANAQYSEDALVVGEQFGLGGIDSVRGFDERYASNDIGHRMSFEAHTPELGPTFNLDEFRLRFLAFYGTGHLKRNDPLRGELKNSSLDSAGVGLRMSYRTNFSLRMDFAEVLHDGTQLNSPTGRTGSHRLHFSGAWVF